MHIVFTSRALLLPLRVGIGTTRLPWTSTQQVVKIKSKVENDVRFLWLSGSSCYILLPRLHMIARANLLPWQ